MLFFIICQYFLAQCSEEELANKAQLDQELRDHIRAGSDQATIKSLVQAKASINRYTDTQPNALCVAVEKENIPILNLLLLHNGDPTVYGNHERQRPFNITINPDILHLLAAWYPPRMYEAPSLIYHAAETHAVAIALHSQYAKCVRDRLEQSLQKHVYVRPLRTLISDYTYGSTKNPLEFMREWNKARAEQYRSSRHNKTFILD